MNNNLPIIRESELYHYGVLGMKWGIRRYQNADGTRTALGKRRERKDYNESTDSEKKSKRRSAAKTAAKIGGGLAGLGLIGAGVTNAATNGGKMSTDETISYWFDRNQKDGKDKPPTSRAEKLGRDARNTQDTLGKTASRTVGKIESKQAGKAEKERREKEREKISKMSDEEIRKRINRMQLEKQYLDLTKPESDPGAWTKQEKIDLGTDIFNGLLTAGSLALSIYALKKGAK